MSITKLELPDWQSLFGHMRFWDSNFSEEHFPLEPEDQVREVFKTNFPDTATGWERFRWAESRGLELARPRATGLYLKATSLHLERPVVSGGEWQSGGNPVVCVYVPIFLRRDEWSGVNIVWLGKHFDQRYVWLFSPKPGT